MVSNKVAAFSIIFGVIIGFQLNQIYVPENFEKPLKFKFLVSVFRTIASLAQFGDKLGIGNEAIIFRDLIAISSSIVSSNDPKVTVSETTLDGSKVRIYTPKSAKDDDKLPIMVFYHGGGYVFGTTRSYDNYLFEFVKKLNMVIVSVDYRMAPENPYPIPTQDCYTATKYVIEHPSEFNADLSRLVLAGDSAGGDAAAVVTARLIKEKLHVPKLQLLIYPWLQKFYVKLPSQSRYGSTGILGEAKLGLSRFGSWYLGITNITDDLIQVYRESEIMGLIENEKERKFILDCLDVKKIPKKYIPDESYYKTAQAIADIPSKVPETSLLRKDPELAKKLRALFHPDVSPLLTPREILTALPKTYMVVYEWDSLKDENLIYAERLKEAGVDVEVAFYTEAFHGMAVLTQTFTGYQKSRDMRDDLIRYLLKNL